jgi:hypothetical protein
VADPKRFAAHETFFAKDVREWAQSRCGDAFWRAELPLMMAWAFGRRSIRRSRYGKSLPLLIQAMV